MKYKGIELEGLDKKVKLSHSRVMETDEGTDWIDKLLTGDKVARYYEPFGEDVPDWLMARAYENTCVRHLNY